MYTLSTTGSHDTTTGIHPNLPPEVLGVLKNSYRKRNIMDDEEDTARPNAKDLAWVLGFSAKNASALVLWDGNGPIRIFPNVSQKVCNHSH